MYLLRIKRRPKYAPKKSTPFGNRWVLEELEPRLAPATIVVNTVADDANLALDSLRAALDSINHGADTNTHIVRTGAYGSNDTIQFDPALAKQTISLAQSSNDFYGPTALIVGSHSHNSGVTIDGSAAPGLTISGPTPVANLRLFYVRPDSSLTLENLTISNGQALGSTGSSLVGFDDLNSTGGDAAGGAVLNRGTLTILNSTFTNNQAGGAVPGGEEEDDDEGFFSTTGGSFFELDTGGGSSSGRGGAVFNDGTLTVVNSTFTGNKAEPGQGGDCGSLFLLFGGFDDAGSIGQGGAIYSDNSAVTIDNSTLSGNSADQGGGLYAVASCDTGTVTVNNTILANTTGGHSDFQGGFLHVTGSGNLVMNPGTGAGAFPAAAIVSSQDPQLAPLASNGGPTQTMAPSPGSPAIGTGDPAKVTNPPFPTPFTDQRGLPRIIGGQVDIGAYQTQTIPSKIATVTTVSTSQASVKYGTPVTFTAVVTASSGTPTGSVEFFDDTTGVDLGAGILKSGSTWTLTTTPTQLQVAAGAQTIRAVFTATGNFLGSSGILAGGETVTPFGLTVVGVTANNKVYDSTTKATLNTAAAALVGVLAGDKVTLNTAGATGAFASKDVGNNIAVAVTGLTLSGPQAGNYSLTQPATTANITPANLTVTGITANDKAFDGTTKATLNTAAAALVGVFSGDTVTLNTSGAVGTFASKDVGDNIAVTISGLTLGGPQAGDYTLTQPTTTASIFKAGTIVKPTIATLELLEGLNGLTPFTFTVALLASQPQPVTFDVFTTDGTAHAGTNYIGIAAGVTAPNSIGTVTFAPGQVYQTVTVWAIAKSIPVSAGPKSFTVSLSDPAHPTVPLATGIGLIIPQDAQMAMGTAPKAPGGVVLSSTAQLSSTLQAAETRWIQAGAKQSAFNNVRFNLANLGGQVLAYTSGTTITIDTSAAGFGWFVDPTPAKDSEFQATANSAVYKALPETPAAGHMDLLTVVEHELGHILGYTDLNPAGAADSLMTFALGAGERRVPTVALANPNTAALNQLFAALGTKKTQDGK